MSIDVVGGIVLIMAAVIAGAASSAGANRLSLVGMILAGLGAYLVYNGYSGYPSILHPYLPYF